MAEYEHLSRLLNTAIIATKIPKSGSNSEKFQKIMESEAFQVILRAIQNYAAEKDIPEEDAARAIVSVFRSLDEIWDNYIFQEGLEKLRGQISS